jgi:hypothetical protein
MGKGASQESSGSIPHRREQETRLTHAVVIDRGCDQDFLAAGLGDRMSRRIENA